MHNRGTVMGDIREAITDVNVITNPNEHYFYGYYDLQPYDSKDEKHLCHRVKFIDRLPNIDDVCELGYIEIASGKFTKLAETTAWNFQQGALLQWYQDDDHIAYNVRTEQGFGTAIQNIITGETRTLPMAAANISKDGKYGLCVNMSRIYDFRPGYGYSDAPDPYGNINAPAEDGVFLMDMKTGDTKQIISYADIISSKTLSFGFSTGKLAGLDTWIDDIYIWSENFSTGETYGPAEAPSLSFMETYQELIDIAAEFSFETNYANLTEDEKTAFKSQIYAFLTDYDALDENAKGNAEVATAYSNIKSMLGEIVQQETGIDDDSFQTQYAETLALDVERLVPYDIPEVDAMLAVYEGFEDVAEYALSAETVAKVTALREARNAWDTTSDTTIAASYEKIWGDKITTNLNVAWNVYNRLTANQKELLADEELYPGLVSGLYAAMKDQAQVKDDTINVYCVGDSLTHGVGSDDATTESYPAQLQTKLATYDSLYTVSKFAVANSHVYKWAVEEGATENTTFTETTQYTSSHDGEADIVILQLGTFDLDNVLALGVAGEEQYLETYESIVQSYLRLENSPYVMISNTPVNYSNIDSTVAELNMQIADKYGLPCVDMYAYTSNYSDEEVKDYYRSN